MTLFATPGVYRQTLEPAYRPGPLVRGDVAVLIGYARRGPVGFPVRLQSLSQFEDVFGAALDGGHLWHGVKGFFECGGTAAYAIRVTDGTEVAASAEVVASPEDIARWRVSASLPLAMLDPARVNRPSRGDLAVWTARVDEEIRQGGQRRPDPGTWGNALGLRVRETSIAVTQSQPDSGLPVDELMLASIAGIETASLLRLSQTDALGTTETHVRAPSWIDASRRRVRLAGGLPAGFDPVRAIRVATVEHDLTITEAGRILQEFRGLSANPAHSRSIAKIFGEAARGLDLSGPGPGTDWTDTTNLPPEGDFDLSGGKDGLASTEVPAWMAAWMGALAAVKRLSDVALIAAPDLVLVAALPEIPEETPSLERPCSNILPLEPGFLSGSVTNGETGQPVSGCLVDVAGVGGSAITGSDGRFVLTDIAAGIIDLRLSMPGFEVLEVTAQSSAFPGVADIKAELVPIVRLPELDADSLLLLQQAMADPEVVGRYKIALVDAPACALDEDALRSRAAELGPEPRLGLFAPWIAVPDPRAEGGQRLVPPSGHVAGAWARAELQGGIFRTGANLALRHADGVAFPIDDAMQAGLNPVGVNAIRAFPGRGIRVHGARSLAVGTDWQFLSVRRIVDAIERTLEIALARLVFEPNSPFLRHAAKATTEAFLARLWREGHLAGAKPEAAFRVTCDDGNNPADTRDTGQLLIEVAVAPTHPFEFIIFRIGHAFDAVQVTEVA